LLSDMRLDLNGTQQSLFAHLYNGYLEANASFPDLNKTGEVRFLTQKIGLASFVSLPEGLKKAYATVNGYVPIDLRRADDINATLQVVSNLANIDATMRYDKGTSKLNAALRVDEDSLLRRWNDRIRWDTVAPFYIDLRGKGDEVFVGLHNAKLRGKGHLNPSTGDVRARIKAAGINIEAEGNIHNDILFATHVDAFKQLIATASSFYEIPNPPKLQGKLDLSLLFSREGNTFAVLQSPHLSYRADRTTLYSVNDLSLVLKKRGENMIVDAYHIRVNDKVFYASTPSAIRLDGSKVLVDAIWINDALRLDGSLDTKRMQGVIHARAKRLPYKDNYVDLNASVDLTATFRGSKTDVEGNIVLLDTRVLYDLGTKQFPSDSDIIIVRKHKSKKERSFYDGLSLSIQITNKNPIVYKQGPLDMQADADINLFKAEGEKLLVLGSVTLRDGGSYLFQGKRFYVKDSHIYFTGNPAEPILDIKVKYKALHYVVTIFINGTPSIPNIIFTSTPYLKREQILSLILFDTVEGGEGDADTMMKMMGGAMAKAALNDLGVSIDHLAIGAGNSIEVGKKISDKAMVIYIEGERPRVELKYEYSPHIEVIMGADERSQSLDVVYKKDFSDKDIVIKR